MKRAPIKDSNGKVDKHKANDNDSDTKPRKPTKKETCANLNKSQQNVYNKMQALLAEGCTSNNSNSDSKVILIDTPSGTGKTFLLAAFAIKHNRQVKFLVFRRDQASYLSRLGLQCYTYVSFCMHHFNLTYQHTVRMYDTCASNEVEYLYELITYAKRYVRDDTSAIILDSYTIASPAMLLLLYILSLQYNIRLIFAGNSLQLDAINKSTFHDNSNFYIVQMFQNATISDLSGNPRDDILFSNKLSNFHDTLRRYKNHGTIPFHFNLRYHLYNIFPGKYFAEERFDTVYIARSHRDIRARLYRFTKHLDEINRPYVRAAFHYKRDNTWLPLPLDRRGKFFPYLLLVEGYRYIYIDKDGSHDIVHLRKILCNDNNDASTLLVERVNDGRESITVERCKLNHYQILPAYRDWLLNRVVHNSELRQFPLRPYALTYHATLGRTIEDEVELNIDCACANFILVGLNCVRRDSDVHMIHTDRDLPSYVVTKHMQDVHEDFEYYYRCPNNKEFDKEKMLEFGLAKRTDELSEVIERIEWTDVDDIGIFERKMINGYMRIKRSVYDGRSRGQISTPLMNAAKFAEKNPNVIRRTLAMMSRENLMSYEQNGKMKRNRKMKNPDAELAYDYLEGAYDNWTRTNDKSISDADK